MKYRDEATGEFKEIYVKAKDTLPIGSRIEYTGKEVPIGWKEVEDKNIITVRVASNYTITSKTPEILILTSAINKIGTKFSITNDGGILIGKNISYIKISAIETVMTPNADESSIFAVITKNNTTMAVGAIRTSSTASNQQIVIPSKLISVKEGDIIYLKVRANSDTGVGSIIAADPNYTYLTIEEV